MALEQPCHPHHQLQCLLHHSHLLHALCTPLDLSMAFVLPASLHGPHALVLFMALLAPSMAVPRSWPIHGHTKQVGAGVEQNKQEANGQMSGWVCMRLELEGK